MSAIGTRLLVSCLTYLSRSVHGRRIESRKSGRILFHDTWWHCFDTRWNDHACRRGLIDFWLCWHRNVLRRLFHWSTLSHRRGHARVLRCHLGRLHESLCGSSSLRGNTALGIRHDHHASRHLRGLMQHRVARTWVRHALILLHDTWTHQRLLGPRGDLSWVVWIDLHLCGCGLLLHLLRGTRAHARRYHHFRLDVDHAVGLLTTDHGLHAGVQLRDATNGRGLNCGWN
jgi:hypothetical protein